MGPEHQQRMADWGTLPEHAEEARGWRQDAGMDLRVEVRTPGGWDTVAWIPSPGWIGARDLAVPLPSDADAVRLSAGHGVFVLDQVATVPVLDDDPTVHRLAPVAAAREVPVDGEDLLAALASADGRRADLTPGHERIDLTFDVPDLGVPVAAFAAAEVHYVPLHTPAEQAEPGLARWMRGHPERFPALVAAEARALQAVADAE
jgi:hypothetical protein